MVEGRGEEKKGRAVEHRGGEAGVGASRGEDTEMDAKRQGW